eukprot:TRINITY_DN20142_c0_g1_i1.p1 TRINITY_DN20142_c0_g1~~TRINITY_DN20142_c0_g1_i1.p1  ORF type:complete len:379 (+),score=57.85 TRINITY_DN20142_c0_g1_i1:214-1350(+)
MTPRGQNQRAGYGTHEVLNVRGKRTNIVNPDTGKLANKTIVSVETPTWFKSSFESNREHFEKQGIAQKLGRTTPEGEVAAGGYVRKATTPRKGAVKIEDTGMIQNQTIVSTRAPDWFKCAFESNRDYFESQGVAQHLKVAHAGGETAAGLPAQQVRMKKTNITDPDTGKLINATIVSSGAPAWFKTAFENNREYFEKQGVAEQRKPQAGAETRAAGHQETHARMKKSNIVDPQTGKISNKTIISKDAPDYFKTAFESNRPYFEKQGVAQKLQNSPEKQRPASAPKQQREEHHRSREERSGMRPASATTKSKHTGDRTGKVSSNERPRSATTPKSKTSGAEKAHSHRHTSAPRAHARESDTSSATSRQPAFQPPPRRHR